jgi:hypothetical protein
MDRKCIALLVAHGVDAIGDLVFESVHAPLDLIRLPLMEATEMRQIEASLEDVLDIPREMRAAIARDAHLGIRELRQPADLPIGVLALGVVT